MCFIFSRTHENIYGDFYACSGLKFIRLGRSVDWSFLMSLAVTLHDSRVSDFKFLSDFRCCRPALDTREFETFKETSCVSPVVTLLIREYRVLTNQKEDGKSKFPTSRLDVKHCSSTSQKSATLSYKQVLQNETISNLIS